MASRHFPRRRLERAASAAKARAFRRPILFEAAGVFLEPDADCIPPSEQADIARPGSPRRAPPPSCRHKFSGDINRLNLAPNPAEAPFLLASLARFLYPIVCLACGRPGRD
jgi:hypothetical protein